MPRRSPWVWVTSWFQVRYETSLPSTNSLTQPQPGWSEHIFTYAGPNSSLKGFLDSLIIILETPFLIAGLIASILNALLPADPEALPEDHEADGDVEAAPAASKVHSVDEDQKER